MGQKLGSNSDRPPSRENENVYFRQNMKRQEILVSLISGKFE